MYNVHSHLTAISHLAFPLYQSLESITATQISKESARERIKKKREREERGMLHLDCCSGRMTFVSRSDINH